MTYTELQKKITHLETELEEVKEMAVAMKKRADGGVFKPEDGREYWRISGTGDVYRPVWSNHPVDHEYYSIGNCYPTEQSAKDTVLVLKLIQKAKESQDGFVPDWENTIEIKRTLHFDGEGIRVRAYTLWHTASIFGFWKNISECKQFIDENHDELIWFFTEYRR